MKKNRYILVSIVLAVGIFGSASAQTKIQAVGLQAAQATNAKQASSSDATATIGAITVDKDGQKTITTKNGDILCVLSNGNTIPCEYFNKAQENIDKKNLLYTDNKGVEFCPAKNKEYPVPCDYVDTNNEIKEGYPELANDIKYFFLKSYFAFTKKLSANLVIAVLMIVVFTFIVTKIKIIKTFSKVFIILVAVVALTVIIQRAHADIPYLPADTVVCTCAQNAAQTCTTREQHSSSPLADLLISACNNSNDYNVTVWSPNSLPPGPMTAGNLDVANGVNLPLSLIPLGGYITGFGGFSPYIMLGVDTNVSCVRQGGIIGTLKTTGRILGVGNVSGSGSSGGGRGIFSIRIQFSCY